MIKVIGTHHLMSKESIEGIIKDFNPDVIGVELCETRFKVFTNQIQQNKEKDDSLMGKIAEETRKKAEENNLDYGSDQKTAMFYAINNNIPLVLVDKDILQIKEDMLKIPLEEQIYLQKELVKFQTESIQTEINEEEIIARMKKDIPNVYKYLVEDRNNHIINKIKEAKEKYKDQRILVFLGKGHLKVVEDSI
jgi:pheromone shutdown protein TraB